MRKALLLIAALSLTCGLLAGPKKKNPPRVVLIHGLGSSPNTMNALGEKLKAQGYAVTIPTLPGAPGGPEVAIKNLEGMVQWLDSRLSSQNLYPCALVGHSMGGTLAFELAALHPEKVWGLVVLDSFPCIPHDPVVTDKMLARYDMDPDLFLKQRLEEVIGDRKLRASVLKDALKWDRGNYRRLLESMRKRDCPQGLNGITCPTLLISASWMPEKGSKPRKDMMRELHLDQIPHLKILRFSNVRHYLQMERPEKTAEAVLAHLKEARKGKTK